MVGMVGLLAGTGASQSTTDIFFVGLQSITPAAWLAAWDEAIEWVKEQDFDPDFMAWSAGFDGLAGDPGNYGFSSLTPWDYGLMAEKWLAWASDKRCAGRVLAILEGGYLVAGGMFSALATAVACVLKALIKAGVARKHKMQEEEREEDKEEKKA